jgi:RimJ/RimL family protein N-acetyltransferase
MICLNGKRLPQEQGEEPLMASQNFWRGDTIRLRALAPKDLDEVVQTPEEADSELERADDAIGFPLSPEQVRARMGEFAKRERMDDSYFWVIENQEGQTVGNIATFDCHRRFGVFKYSIVLKRPFWRKGYGHEAVRLVLRYYFRELRYQKVTVLIYSFNERSIHFHEAFGFTFEGRLRRMVFTNGRFYDELYYGMTAEEFEQVDPRLDLPEYGPADSQRNDKRTASESAH